MDIQWNHVKKIIGCLKALELQKPEDKVLHESPVLSSLITITVALVNANFNTVL